MRSRGGALPSRSHIAAGIACAKLIRRKNRGARLATVSPVRIHPRTEVRDMHRTLLATLMLILFGAMSSSQAANLLINPGFEDGYNSWSTTGAPDLRHSDPAPFEGNNYAFSIANSHYTLQQDVSLLAAGFLAEVIDSGALLAHFGGWQSGYETQSDEGQIRLLQLDDGLQLLDMASLPYFHSNSTWVEQSASIALLPGTRTLRFFFDGLRHAGSNNDAYLDATFLEVAPVPVPGALPLGLSALVSLALLGRRARRRASGAA
jgi:hypothetical protein